MTRQVESGGPDVYAGLNLLVRRKPKENNFKAILDCIRDLMSEDTAVPPWLHDIFLGYGDPAAAQFRNMPDAVPTLDFKARSIVAADCVRACWRALTRRLPPLCCTGHVPGRRAPGVVLPGARHLLRQRGARRRAGAALSRHVSGAAAACGYGARQAQG